MNEKLQTVELTEAVRPEAYGELLAKIKQEIKSARLRTAVVVNIELVALYWRIGNLILERQRAEGWGAKVIDRLSVDLRTTFPHAKGFSATTLDYLRAFATAWREFSPQLVGRLPWGHIRLLLDKVPEPSVREFYMQRVVEEGWSRNILLHHVRHGLHERIGAAPNTFDRTVAIDDDVVVEFALETVGSPVAVSTWSALPPEVRRQLPTEEELTTTLNSALDDSGAAAARRRGDQPSR